MAFLARPRSPFTPRTRFEHVQHTTAFADNRAALCVSPEIPDYLHDALESARSGRLKIRLTRGLALLEDVLHACGYDAEEALLREPPAQERLRLLRDATFSAWALRAHRAATRETNRPHQTRKVCVLSR